MRLIDADALKKKAVMCPTVGNSETLLLDISDVENAPTIEERKTGRWNDDGTCSVCGTYSSLNLNKVKYCPECGAKMEGADE